MKTSDPMTLQYHLETRAAHALRDLSWVSMKDARVSIKEWTPSTLEHPEQEAVRFYAAQQVLAMAQQQIDPRRPLSVAQHAGLEEVYAAVNDTAARALKYLVLICVREARHLRESVDFMHSHHMQAYPEQMRQFWREVNSTGHQACLHKLNTSLKLNSVTLGDVCSSLTLMFDCGQWSSSYGGKKWAAVSRVLEEYVFGVTNAIQMCDTVWTLAHNGGPIFNKGYLYHCHDAEQLQKVLDVQRSGQIVEAMLGNELHTPLTLKARTKAMQQLVPDWHPRGYVDWYLVEELGALGCYEGEKLIQQGKHGLPHDMAAKLKKHEQQQAAALAELHAKTYVVDFKYSVKKETRDDS